MTAAMKSEDPRTLAEVTFIVLDLETTVFQLRKSTSCLTGIHS